MLRTWALVLIGLSTVGCTLEATRSGHALTAPILITIPTVPIGTEDLTAAPKTVFLIYTWTDNLQILDPTAPPLHGFISTTLLDGTTPIDTNDRFQAGGYGVRGVIARLDLPEGLPEGFEGRLVAVLEDAFTGQTLIISSYPISLDHTPPVLQVASTVRTDSSLTITATLSDPGSGIATVSVQPTVNGSSTAPSALQLVSGNGFSATSYSGTLAGLARLDVVGVDLTASDARANTMQVPGLPVANSGGSSLVACDSPTGASVLLDGSRSTGWNGTSLIYTWKGPFGSASGITTTASLDFGANPLTLTVTDGRGFTGTQDSVITVGDQSPPSLSVQATPSCLWPPNNKLVALSLSNGIKVSASDTCDVNPQVRIVSVTSSDGTPVSFNSERVCLLAQKDITYTITVEARDSSGNTTQSQTTVVVPHSSAAGCAQAALKADDPACLF